jgi:cytochrome c biogenesis protein CcmG/thiol:disulfide interchange protein DsbE
MRRSDNNSKSQVGNCNPSCPAPLNRRAFLRGGAASAALILSTGAPRIANANALRVGSPAPPATLAALDGERISTAQLLGQVVILTFWATWCAPCRQELPLLSNYAAQHAAGLRVLGFALDSPDRLPEVQEVAAALHFPVGFLANSSAPGYGRIWRLPVNFTIDRSGRLVDDGWQEKKPTWTRERLEEIVTPLLTERGGQS